jgi:peroxiredoxin Q/BCP
MNRGFRCALVVCVLLLPACSMVRAEEGGVPEVGKAAPSFDLPATQIDKVLPDKKDASRLSLKDLRGKNVVLFFYPKAMTKGCTIESCGFRDRIEKFTAQDTVVIGISNDTLEDQGKFTKKEKLSFPLLADTDKTVTKSYGALSPRGFPARYTFVIDKKGVLRKVYTKVTPATHPDEVLDYVKGELNKK